VEAAQQDPRRFADLYDAHFDRVYAYIARRVRDRVDAEDLTSEVFHQALAGLPRFEWRGAPFSAWLFKIAANAIADHARSTSREPRVADADWVVDSGLDQIEFRARLFRAVRQLPEDQRRVIQMRFAEEKSIQETARAMGRSEGAVKQLQFRGLETLRARMGITNG